MLLPREQREDVPAVREPGEEAIEEQQQEDGDHEPVCLFPRIAQAEEDALHRRQRGDAQKRAHRTPFARPDVKEGQDEDAEHDEDHPPILAAECEGEHPEGGGDALAALELHGDGIDMPDDDGHAAHIPREVGDRHVRPREHIAAENEVGDEHGQAALDHVEQQRQRADLEAELPAHVHGAGVAAAHLAHVLVLDLGDEQGEIETADQVRSGRHHDEPVPDL